MSSALPRFLRAAQFIGSISNDVAAKSVFVLMAEVRNHVSPLWCFKIPASIFAFFRGGASYNFCSLKFLQNILPMEKKYQGSFR